MEIDTPDGSKARSFDDIASAGKAHFQNLFKGPKVSNIADTMKVIRLFPRLFDQRMNDRLEADVTKEELKGVLFSFKKAKSPGPDGWTVEFYLGFYNMLEGELLRVVGDLKNQVKYWGRLTLLSLR
jgi:hypothetical protein